MGEEPRSDERSRAHHQQTRSAAPNRSGLEPSGSRDTQGVGGHEIVPGGGHVGARWWPTVLPTGGQQFCPR